MKTPLNILIVSDTYTESAGLTPLLRDMGHNFTLLTDATQIAKISQFSDFDALFISLPYLRQAARSFLIALKTLPWQIPLFFIANQDIDADCYACAGVRAIDTISTGADLEFNLQRCLRIAGHMQPPEGATHAYASTDAIKPLHAQLSNLRMLNKLILEEVSRERLIKQVCHNMSKVAGYQHVWINLQQKHGGYRTHSGGQDIDKKSGALLTRMPHCVDLAHLHIPQIIADYEGDCADCPFCEDQHSHACLYHPLKFKGEPVGELCALVDLNLVGTSEFMSMFKEMADDLARATYMLTIQKMKRCAPLSGADGEPFSIDYIRQLEMVEQRFQALFRNMPRVAVQGYNKNREVIFWNKASEEFYGYSEAEAYGKKIEELIMPEFMIDFALQAIKDWEEKGIPIPAAECSLKHKEGHFVPVFSSHAGFNNLDGDFEMYCLDINLSEIKEAQEAVEQLSKFPSEDPNPIMRLNTDGEILYANAASEHLLKLWNKQIGDIIPEKYLNYAREAIQASAVHYHRIGCEETIYNAAFTPVNHGVNYLNIYALDVTDREQAFKELKQAKHVAEAANLAKNDFLANMSHELRTPLNGIMGMAQLLEQTTLSTEQQDEVDSIIASANTLLEVLTDILDITAIERDQITLTKEAFNLQLMLQHAVDMISPTARSKQIRIHYRYPQDRPLSFYGDKKHLTQVIINVLGNAVKFTNSGSISIGITVDEAGVAIAVTDTGIGIPSDKIDHIFQKFTQIDSSRSRRYNGAGLGLNISKHLIERMGGTINVESQLGKGSTFTITLPLQATENSDTTTRPTSMPNDYPARVLLAEDNRVNQLVAEKMLKSLGCEVDIADNGKMALDCASKNNYDLIFMDIQMPEMNGLDATRAIRKLDGTGRLVPIIALTAHAMSEDIDACTEAGMNNYLSKPVKFDDLKALFECFQGADNDPGKP